MALCVMLAFACAGCGQQEMTDQWLIQKSLEAAARLSDLAGWTYIRLISENWSATTAAALKGRPVKVQILSCSHTDEEQLWTEVMKSLPQPGLTYQDMFPDDAPEVIKSRRHMAITAIPSYIISRTIDNAASNNSDGPTIPQVANGTMTFGDAVTLYNLCTDGWACEGPGAMEESIAVYLEYDEYTAVLVLFLEGDAAHVGIQSRIVPVFDPDLLQKTLTESIPAAKDIIKTRSVYTAEDLQSMGF